MKILRLIKFPKLRAPRPRKAPAPKQLRARTRTADAPLVDSYEDDEPQTKLTSAFIVVLILHVVAVGGIYAFNQIKSSRRNVDASASSASSASKSEPKEPQKASASATAGPRVDAAIEAPAPAPRTVGVTTPATAIAPVMKQRVYNVRAGDTLISIAKAFSVSVSDLKAANGLGNEPIRPGQVLNLPTGASKTGTDLSASPQKATEPAEAHPQYRTYTVKSGDRLIFIAKKLNVTQEDLIAANKIKDPAKLQIGQTLKVPVRK